MIVSYLVCCQLHIFAIGNQFHTPLVWIIDSLETDVFLVFEETWQCQPIPSSHPMMRLVCEHTVELRMIAVEGELGLEEKDIFADQWRISCEGIVSTTFSPVCRKSLRRPTATPSHKRTDPYLGPLHPQHLALSYQSSWSVAVPREPRSDVPLGGLYGW